VLRCDGAPGNENDTHGWFPGWGANANVHGLAVSVASHSEPARFPILPMRILLLRSRRPRKAASQREQGTGRKPYHPPGTRDDRGGSPSFAPQATLLLC